MMRHICRLCAGLVAAIVLAGCTPPEKADYTAFKQSRPRSILVLPPLNESPDVKATYGVYAAVTRPLAEAGYYVLPVALVDETFKQNGLANAGEINTVPAAKLRQIYGADAALYVTVTEYGTSYQVIASATVVAAKAQLVDLKTGATLWTGSAAASSNEGQGASGGLIGILVTAAVTQIVNSATDAGDAIAPITTARLLSGGLPNGILYGPRSPKYGSD
jgi:hypothetical protein